MEVHLRRYFDFHEAPEAPESGVSPSTHGVTPVWGFGTVIASTHLAIHVGERVYGYFAPTRFLIFSISPSDVNQFAFAVSRPHLPEGIVLPWTNSVLFFTVFRQKTLQSNYQMLYRSPVRFVAQCRGSHYALPSIVLDFLLVRRLAQYLAISWRSFPNSHFLCVS